MRHPRKAWDSSSLLRPRRRPRLLPASDVAAMVAEHYLQLRTDVEAALTQLLKVGTELRRAPETLDTINGLLRDVREPLLFVVVGEVKSGKSSLLNALFGQEFAKVDVLPATDKVCIFRYGEEEKQVDVSPRMIER